MYDDDFGYEEYCDDLQDFSDREAWEDAQADMRDHVERLVEDRIREARERYSIFEGPEANRYIVTDEETGERIGIFDFLEHAHAEINRLAGVCSCGKGWAWEQYDYYGIYAGRMCDDCFGEKYRQDAYFDPGYAGESLDEDW